MQVAAANDPAPANPLPGFDVDAELPDWEEFARMLPHTPPVENRRHASGDDVSSVSRDERSAREWWSTKSSSSSIDETVVTRMVAGIAPGNNTIVVGRPSANELTEILEVCKRSPQITILEINPPTNSTFPLNAQEKLIEFFSDHQSIRELRLVLHRFFAASIHPKLLAALIQNQGLKALKILDGDLISPAPEDRQAFFDGIKRNSSLEYLGLRTITNGELIADMVEALAESRTLKRLDLEGIWPEGIGKRLARLLTACTSLSALKITPILYRGMEAIDCILDAITRNQTLEVLDIRGSLIPNGLLMENLIKPLILNQALKEIFIPDSTRSSDGAANALIELIKTHPTLTSIHIGSVSKNHQRRMSMAQALKSNPRLSKISVNILAFCAMDIRDPGRPLLFTEFLNALGDCPGLTSLRLEGVPDFDCLVKFLETHPKIGEIVLPLDGISKKEDQEKLLALVRSHAHIKTLTIAHPFVETKQATQFRKELQQALAINREVTSEPRIAEASEAMKVLLDKKSATDEQLPFVPLDVTNELAKAIARHLLPAKAKAIFDALIVHAAKRH